MKSPVGYLGMLMIASWAFMMSIPNVTADYSPNWIWEDPFGSFARSVDISRDGQTIVAGSRLYPDLDEGKLAIFDWRSAWPLFTLYFSDTFVVVVKSSDNGGVIAYCLLDTLYVVTRTGEPLWEFNFSSYGSPTCLDFDASANRLVLSVITSAGNPHRTRVLFFDVSNGDLLWIDDPGDYLGVPVMVHKVNISGDGRWIVVPLSSPVIPGPVWVALYDQLSTTPSVPVWITELSDSCTTVYAESAREANYFIANASTIVQYHDFSAPVGSEKTPLWQSSGGGYWGLGSRCSISNDGSVTAFHGGAVGDTVGHAEVYLGADGTKVFDTETLFLVPLVDVSGDGSRVVFGGDVYKHGIENCTTLIWDRDANDIIWMENALGCPILDDSGSSLIMGSGRDEDMVWSPLMYYRIEDNDPPICTITSPEPGDSVSGIIAATGTSQDNDDTVIKVEVLVGTSLQLAESVGAGLENWTADIDMSSFPEGLLTIKTRAVDSRHKHGPWNTIEVMVIPTSTAPPATATPSPPPSQTPPPQTPTPTPDPDFPLGLSLVMPGTFFASGDPFYLDVAVMNPGQPHYQLPLVVLLEVHGLFFAWPDWIMLNSQSIPFVPRDFPVGMTVVEVIPEFTWPQTTSDEEGLVVYSIVMSPDFSVMMSNLGLTVFGYGM